MDDQIPTRTSEGQHEDGESQNSLQDTPTYPQPVVGPNAGATHDGSTTPGPVRMQMTGPWFVLKKKGYTHLKQWEAQEFNNEQDAVDAARLLIQEGETLVYLSRGLIKAEVPVQMTQLIEAMPVVEEEG